MLAYYTVGYQNGYIKPMSMSIKSLRNHSPSIDVWVLCDENMVEEVRKVVPTDVKIYSRLSSTSPEIASMQKLSIFQQDLSGFEKVIYIDADILIGVDISPFLAKVHTGKLYAYKERADVKWHRHIFWSLQQYTDAEIEYFRMHGIFPFNAGLFAFVPTTAMKWHFEGVLQMIRSHKGAFFYEQSFMNIYFNKRNLIDYSVFTDEIYNMGLRPLKHIRMILHFAGHPGSAVDKNTLMTRFAQKYMPYLLEDSSATADGSEKLNTCDNENIGDAELPTLFPSYLPSS